MSGQCKTVPCRSVRGRAAIIDTETTGLNPKVSEILQLAIIDGDDGSVVLNEFFDVHSD